jgi:hypothetical protein
LSNFSDVQKHKLWNILYSSLRAAKASSYKLTYNILDFEGLILFVITH